MKSHSWVDEVRSILELGEFVTLPDQEQDERQEKLWIEQLRRPLPVPEHVQRYFGTRLHDSWLTRIRSEDDGITLELDSMDGDILAIGLADALQRQRSRRRWPIHLHFERVRGVRLVRPDLDGSVSDVDLSIIRPTRRPRRQQDQFRYDWFIEPEQPGGTLRWVAELDLSIRLAYLLIECEEVQVTDLRRQALVKAFGEVAGPIWDEAFESKEDIWHMKGALEFVKTRLEPANSLTR